MRTKKPSGPTFRRLKALAAKRGIIVSTTDFAAKAPPDAKRLLSYVGGVYHAAKADHEPYIWLNPRFALHPTDFVFAHELAHHWQAKRGVVFRQAYRQFGDERNLVEDQANRFASKLLALLERKHRK